MTRGALVPCHPPRSQHLSAMCHPRGPTWLLRLLTSSTRGHGRVKTPPPVSLFHKSTPYRPAGRVAAFPASRVLRHLLTSGPAAVKARRDLGICHPPALPGWLQGRRSGTLNQTTVTVNNVCHRLGMGHKNQINDGHYSGDCDYDNENNKGDHHYDHDDNDNTVMMNYNE